MSGYVLFQSTQAAARAEAVLSRAGYAVRLVPTPRHLSSECGTALAFDPCGVAPADIEGRLREGDVPYTGIHVMEPQPAASRARCSSCHP